MINPGGPGTLLKLTLAAVAAALITPAAAAAAVTVGQSPPTVGTPPVLPPAPPAPPVDYVQVSNTSGNSYTVPAGGGVITAWRTSTGTGSVGLRVFNVQPGGATPAGESAIETLTASPTQFATRIPVAGGERLGLVFEPPFSVTDLIYQPAATGDVVGGATSGPLGQLEPFAITQPQVLLNVSAQLEPDADKDGYGDETQDLCPTDASTHDACPDFSFTIGKKKLNKKKGTAKVSVAVPAAGTLTLSGKDVATTHEQAAQVGTIKIDVKPKGKAKKKLKKKGKAKVKVTIAFAPVDGEGSEQTTKLKLKRS